MSVFTSVGILLFSMLIMACLQFAPGTFALLYHAQANKFSKHKIFHVLLFYILGVETAVAFFFIFLYFIINSSFNLINIIHPVLFSYIGAGIFLGLAIVFYLRYFRKGPGTRLFVSRQFMRGHLQNIKNTKTRADVFLLGALSVVPELIFSLPVFIITIVAIMSLGTFTITRAALTLLFILSAIFPLLILYVSFSKNSTLADFMRFRFQSKSFFRLLITFSYLMLSILIILGVLL